MADVQHADIQSAKAHEPKHITTAATSDNGKVITPSSSTAGTSALAFLEGDKVASTSETVGKVLTADGDDTSSWQDPADLVSDTVNTQTGTTYTFVLTDRANTNSGTIVVTMENASAITATVPPNSSVAYGTGTIINIAQLGAGTITVAAGAGVTVNGNLVSQGQYFTMSLLKVDTDTWLCLGGTT